MCIALMLNHLHCPSFSLDFLNFSLKSKQFEQVQYIKTCIHTTAFIRMKFTLVIKQKIISLGVFRIVDP